MKKESKDSLMGWIIIGTASAIGYKLGRRKGKEETLTMVTKELMQIHDKISDCLIENVEASKNVN